MKPKYVASLGGLLLLIGSLLPWATISVAFATRNINGTEGDGIFTLLAGILIALAALAGKDAPGERATLAGILGLLAFLFIGYKMVNLSGGTGSISGIVVIQTSLGVGIWMCLAGSIIAFAGGMARNPATSGISPVNNVQTVIPPTSTDERLAKLADLKAKGLIDEMEYNTKRQQILDNL